MDGLEQHTSFHFATLSVFPELSLHDVTSTVFFVLHLTIVLFITARILWRYDFTPAARLAWFIVILVLPYLGSLVYWLFGETKFSFEQNEKRTKTLERIKNSYPETMVSPSVFDIIEPQYHAGFDYAASLNGFHTTKGNQAQLMADAQTARRRMIEDFDAASERIHVLYYIWLNDNTGQDVAHALIRAVKRGVTCRAMVDGLGSRAFLKSSLWQQMKEAGVQTAVALPLNRPIKTLLLSRIDLRNHRKITVIDGKVVYCGSQNCADPEFRVKPKYAPWVDILLRFKGPVVAQTERMFASDWLLAHPKTPLSAFACQKNEAEAKHQANLGFCAQVFADGPSLRRDATPQLFCTLFASARQTLIISTPYFVPDRTMLNALCAAAYRGVDVKLIVPKNNDSWIVAMASRSHYRQLLDAGVELYEYRKGLLHSKTLTIDGKVSLVGSSNLDLRSFNLNFENNILLYDTKITADIRERQNDYMADSDQILNAEVKRWSMWRQISYNVVATVGPVL